LRTEARILGPLQGDVDLENLSHQKGGREILCSRATGNEILGLFLSEGVVFKTTTVNRQFRRRRDTALGRRGKKGPTFEERKGLDVRIKVRQRKYMK